MEGEMTATVESVAERRAMLKALGSRPDREAVEQAQRAMNKIDAKLIEHLDGTYYAVPPVGVNAGEWRESQVGVVNVLNYKTVGEWRDSQERDLRESAEKEKSPYKAILKLDELHQLYEEKLEEEERALDGKVYDPDVAALNLDDGSDSYASVLIQVAFEKKRESLDLSKRSIAHVPEIIGRIVTLVTLNLSSNQLQELPDSIAGLVNLQMLNLHANQLKTLPDSIGLLTKLQYLDVSSNSIKRLPDSLGRCSSLVEIDANFNQLEYISSNFGSLLENLEKLDLHLNKLSAVPGSICELKALKFLDLHMNKLRSLPTAIGCLSRLEYLDVSSNFNDLVALPESIGDLISLSHCDLSFNQIRELPDSMGRLEKLKTLNLDGNPMTVPPMEIAEQSVEAVMDYMQERWRRSVEVDQQAYEQAAATPAGAFDYTGWTTWAGASVGSWIGSWWGTAEAGPDGGKGVQEQRRDDFLEQQL